MASIAFKKIHGKGEFAPTLRHSDTQERLLHNHSNVDIDKALTPSNTQLKQLTYRETLQYYDDYLKRLDHHNKNKRKDRVTCFELVFSFPDVPKEQWQAVAQLIYDFIREKFSEKNVINAYLHQDEIHQYYDKGEIKTSRPHIHAFVVPEYNGQLNGKRFSSRANMQALNRDLDECMYRAIGIHYLTHEKPRKKTVEQLKIESYEELEQAVRQDLDRLKDIGRRIEAREDFERLANQYAALNQELDYMGEELERERSRSRGRGI